MTQTVQQIGIDEIDESPQNPRQSFDSEAMTELTASIASVGILVPLLVRPENGRFELIAGARRLRAARAAGLEAVPAIVRRVPEGQARDEAIIENLQREGIPPLEEAQAIQALFGDEPVTLERVRALAPRLSKAPRYLWQRLRLLALVLPAQRLLRDGRLPLAHAEALARLTPADQARALDLEHGGLFEVDRAFDFDGDHERTIEAYEDRKPVSLREFKAWIADHVRFQPAAFAQTAPLDFGEVAALVDEAAHQPGRGRKVIPITHDTFVKPDARAEERTYCAASWKRADGLEGSQPCDHAILGVIVVGPGYGEAFRVCVRKECDIHWKKERLAREKRQRQAGDAAPGGKVSAWEEDNERYEARRAREEATRRRFTAAAPAITAALVKAIRTRSIPLLGRLILDYAGFSRDGLRTAKAQLGSPGTADQLVRYLALIVSLERLDKWTAPAQFPKFARPLGVDVTAILRNVQAGKLPGTPGICRRCGCTQEHACPGGCGWADKTRTICTRCQPGSKKPDKK